MWWPAHRQEPSVPYRRVGYLFREFQMARHCSFSTSKVEEWRSIDLADLRRWRMLRLESFLKTGKIQAIVWTTPHGREELGVVAGASSVMFVKSIDGQLYKLLVPYVFTATRFGGRRAWFQCPGCRQACRVLYGTSSLRCRKCRGLKYESQYQTAPFRLLDRAHKIRRRLGKPGASGDPLPPKPRYMRWRTYWRLERLVDRLEQSVWPPCRSKSPAQPADSSSVVQNPEAWLGDHQGALNSDPPDLHVLYDAANRVILDPTRGRRCST